MMPHWLSSWLSKPSVIDAPDCIPSVGAFGRVCLSGDYQHVTYITDTGRISAVPASVSKDDAVMVYHDPVVNAQAAASALSRHGHNKAAPRYAPNAMR